MSVPDGITFPIEVDIGFDMTTRDRLLDGVVLTPSLVDDLMVYMRALTDDAARVLTRVGPARVPSGLPVDGRAR